MMCLELGLQYWTAPLNHKTVDRIKKGIERGYRWCIKEGVSYENSAATFKKT